MTILDTNVISAIMNDPPDDKVVAWLDRQAFTTVWTTSITVFEIETGLGTMAAGKKQAALSQVFERILSSIDHRIAVFDEEAARLAANLTAFRQKKGRVGELRDTMIAGIVLAHHASLATRNVTHFSDIQATVVNPWTA
ncbi:MAG TPA: type II toxin-antitoxin system VapC family toxin [Candidatus Udaeobacter sp.]|nr:type II toxin-antitoxin system VapC family toxin [Candidatus Udaeobacter sp.]